MSKDTGGLAFPQATGPYPGYSGGMTLRDYAEIKIMAAIVNANIYRAPRLAAAEAIDYVDAWLAERGKND